MEEEIWHCVIFKVTQAWRRPGSVFLRRIYMSIKIQF